MHTRHFFLNLKIIFLKWAIKIELSPGSLYAFFEAFGRKQKTKSSVTDQYFMTIHFVTFRILFRILLFKGEGIKRVFFPMMDKNPCKSCSNL